MNKVGRISVMFIGIMATSLPAAASANASAVCTDKSYSESFASGATNENNVSSVINWASGGPIFGTHKQGAFPLTNQNPERIAMSDQIVAADANAMYLMPNRRNALIALSTQTSCQLVAYGLVDATSWDNAPDFDTASRMVIDNQASCGQSPMVLTGDVAGDGNMDIVTISPTNIRTSGEIDQAYLYVRKTGSTAFARYDITAPLVAAGISVHGGTPAVLGDVDGDGSADLLIASSSGTTSKMVVFYANDRSGTPGFGAGVVLLQSLNLGTPIASANAPATTDTGCQGFNDIVSRGATAVAFADVDGDLLPDIIVGTESGYGMRIALNQGRGLFQLQPNVASYSGSIRIFVQDMDGDGDADLVGIRSGRGCEGGHGRGWIGFNDGQLRFVINPNGNFGVDMSPTTSTVNWAGLISMPLRFPDGTQAAGGAPSLIIGKASGQVVAASYYNMPASDLYVTQAIAIPRPITSAGAGATTLVQVGVNNIATSIPSAGGSVAFDVSADSGRHWERLQSYEMDGTQPHVFTHFGQELRWRAILNSTPTTLDPSAQGYIQATRSPSKLSRVNFNYKVATPSSYTRSKPAYMSIPINGTAVDHALQATFDFPGFVGHLQAQNLSAYQVGNANDLQTLTPQSTWDAADVLRGQAATTRAIYSLSPQGNINVQNMTTVKGTRIPFSAGEFASGSTTPSLQTLTEMDPSRGAQYINMIRNTTGNADGYKLRDPGHSSPVPIVPPNDDPAYLGNNYAGFVTAQKNRTPMILMGANDGMLHAFNAQSGAESWAYVPSNLLSKVQTQLSTSGGQIIYKHDAFVDGPITISDVYAQNQWRTIAVVGQGEGSTNSGTNFYHAVDVTDPSQCVPLWEMTEGLVESVKLCNPDPCASYVCSVGCTYSAFSCQTQNSADFAEMDINTNNRDASFQTYGMLEAEHFDSTLPSTGQGPMVNWQTFNANQSPGGGRTSSSTSFMRLQGTSNACAATSFPDLFQCASLSYRIEVEDGAGANYTPYFLLYKGNAGTRITVVLDDLVIFSGQPTWTSGNSGWQWAKIPSQALSENYHTLQIFMLDPDVSIDRVALIKSGNTPGNLSETANYICPLRCSTNGCQQYCIANPDSEEWPTCGVGANKKCCPINQTGYCADVDQPCGQPASRMGQSFSPPAIGRIKTNLGDKFVAFFASGYNDFPASVNVGRSIYMVDAFTGTPMGSWNLTPVSQTGGNPAIEATVPGGVSIVDADNDGYVDRLYVGDLSGRLWKLNTQATANLAGQGMMTNPGQYATCMVFDAGNQGGSVRQWAPIITKPAVVLLAGTTPNIYFGTGGDNLAPVTVPYSFYSVRDTDSMSACTQSARTASSLSTSRLEWQVKEAAGHGRFWADPTVVDGTNVVFSSYIGSPDSVNPCVSSAQASHIYGIAAKAFTDASGKAHTAGQSVWSNNRAFLTASGIVRTAATIRGQTVTSQVARAQSVVSAAPKDLLFQQFTGELLRVSSVGVQGPSKRLRVISIREIPR